MEQDEINDLNENLLHLRNRLGDNINDVNNKLQYIEEGGILNEDQGQRNHFGNANNISLANNIPLAQNEYSGGANNNDDDNDILPVKIFKIDTKVHYLNIVLLALMLIFVKIIKTLFKEKMNNNLLSIAWER